MPIPAFTTDGLLPPGVHDCTLDELRERFGSFQGSDRRCRLFDAFEAFVREAKGAGVVRALIVDGSFVTDRDDPGDIDVIIVSLSSDELPAELRPAEYNVLSKSHIRRNYGLDVLLAHEGHSRLSKYIDFFPRCATSRLLVRAF
jgi:hypothetical protein